MTHLKQLAEGLLILDQYVIEPRESFGAGQLWIENKNNVRIEMPPESWEALRALGWQFNPYAGWGFPLAEQLPKDKS